MTLTVETWCEALESGKYEQGERFLRVNDQFCCLGVACDLSGLGEWHGRAYETAADRQSEYLPHDVKLALHLADDAGYFDLWDLPSKLREEIRVLDPEVKDRTSLIHLNDAAIPFPLIAKVIRARPKGLFREGDAS